MALPSLIKKEDASIYIGDLKLKALGKKGFTGLIEGSTLKLIIPQCSKNACNLNIEQASPAKCLLQTIYIILI